MIVFRSNRGFKINTTTRSHLLYVFIRWLSCFASWSLTPPSAIQMTRLSRGDEKWRVRKKSTSSLCMHPFHNGFARGRPDVIQRSNTDQTVMSAHDLD